MLSSRVLLTASLFLLSVSGQTIQLKQSTWQGRQILYQEIDGEAVIEGDIRLGPVAAIEQQESQGTKSQPRNALMTPGALSLWPGGVIPYVIEAALPNQARVLDAISHWNTRTGIRIIPRTSQSDYVLFRPSGGCNSYVGRVGGLQEINLAPGCGKGTVIHEIGHAAGMWHEHQRPDRDRYLTINTANADTAELFSVYPQQLQSDLVLSPYDFSSIMHYWGATGFNGKVVIDTVPSGIPLGGESLTAHDVDAIQRRYLFTANSFTVDSNPPGLQVKVDGLVVAAPATFNWSAGSAHTLEAVSGQLTDGGHSRWMFGRWSDDGSQVHNITAGNLSGPGTVRVYTVHHYGQNRILTALWEPWRAQGSAAVTPAAADNYYRNRQEFQVIATPNPGRYFLRWQNLSSSSQNPASFESTFGKTIYAQFADSPVTTFTCNVEDSRINVDGTQYLCPVAFDWVPGSVHTLSVQPDQIGESYGLPGTRRIFVGWNHGGPAAQTLTVPARGLTYSASFRLQYRLQTAGDGNGTVTTSPAPNHGYNNGYFDKGTSVLVTAGSTPGSQFVAWNGDASGASPFTSVLMDKPKFVAGIFNHDTCAVSLPDGPSITAPATGGLIQVRVNAGSSCYWISDNRLTWAGTTSAYTTTGNAIATLQIAENTAGSPRSGYVTFGNQSLLIQQLAAGASTQSGCVGSILPSDISVSASGATGTFVLNTTSPGCSWTVSSRPPWLQIFPSSGTGTATPGYTAYPNFTSQTRIGIVVIDGQQLSIVQSTASALSEQKRFVTLVYFNFLGRYPTQSEIDFQFSALASGTTRTTLVMNFYGAEEFNRGGRFIAGLYAGLLFRDAEFSGWRFQRNALATNVVNQDSLVSNFLASPEFLLANGSLSTEAFVNLLYRQILGRTAAPAEVALQAGALNSGPQTRVGLASAFLNSAEFRSRVGGRLTAFLLYATLLGRDPSTAEFSRAQTQLSAGTTVSDIVTPIVATPEFTAGLL
ncbi:MAG: DUF4214 domain-containing protein [Bryobacteraceae bacterium]|nr:DUF4214 domain-containing protein [Bryobacteraceae bacterium]